MCLRFAFYSQWKRAAFFVASSHEHRDIESQQNWCPKASHMTLDFSDTIEAKIITNIMLRSI